jgi:hypothetical protein
MGEQPARDVRRSPVISVAIMKMFLLALGMTAILVGLLFSSLVWDEYSGNTSACRDAESAQQRYGQILQQAQAARGTEQEGFYRRQIEAVSALTRMCEEDKLSGRNLLLIFSRLRELV